MAKKNRQVKDMEQAPKEESAPVMVKEVMREVVALKEEAMVKEASPKVDFDVWFVMRNSKIPKTHHKEVIMADFKGRGLSQCESLEDFDAALKKYGINLV